MAIEVGSAYVSIVPSFRGFGDQVAKQAQQAGDQIGEAAGEGAAEGISERVADGMADGVDKGTKQTRTKAKGAGEGAGEDFLAEFNAVMAETDAIKFDADDAILKSFKDTSAAQQLGAQVDTALADGVTANSSKVDDAVTKVSSNAGSKGGEEAGREWTRMLDLAMAGTPLLAAGAVSGVGLAFAGLAVYALKSNQQIKTAFDDLKTDVSKDLTDAAAPLAPTVTAAIAQIAGTANTLAPELKSAFAGAAPIVTDLVTGVDEMALHAMPGFVSAIHSAQPVVGELEQGLSGLGTGINGFIRGLSTTGAINGATQGLHALFVVIDELLPDLGKIIGTLASGIGPAFNAIAPAVMSVVNVFSDLVSDTPAPVIEALTIAVIALWTAWKGQSILSSVSGLFSGIGSAAESAATETAASSAAAEAAGGKFETFGAYLKNVGGQLTGFATGLVGTGTEAEAASAELDDTAASVTATGDAARTAQLGVGGFGAAMSSIAGPLSIAGVGMSMIQSNMQQLQTTLNKQPSQTRSWGAAFEAVTGDMSGAFSTIMGGANKTTTSLNSVALAAKQKLTPSITSAAAAAQQAAPHFEGASFSLQTVAQAAGLTKADLDGADAAWQEWTGNLSTSQALVTVRQDLLGLTQQTKTYGTTLSDSSTKGVANQQVMLQDLQAIQQLGQTQIKAGANIRAANASVAQQILDFEQAAVKAGYNKTQVDALIKSTLGIPKSAGTTLTLANLEKYLNGVDAAKKAIDSVKTSVTSVVRIIASASNPNPVRGAKAGGGPVESGQTYLVGEQGPELLTMGSQPGNVIPTAQTLDILARSRNLNALGTGPMPAGTVGAGTTINYYGAPASPQATANETARRLALAGVS